MHKFKIGTRFVLYSLMVFMGFAALAGFTSWMIYDSIRSERIDKVRGLAEAATSMVKAAYGRSQSGELSVEAAQALVKDQIRKLRYGVDDYFFVYDYDGFNIAHGAKPEREGKNFYNDVDTSGVQLVKAQIDRARDGTGVVYLMFPRMGSTVPVPKVTYTIAFEPWHWVIGTGVYVDDIDARFAKIAWQFFSIAVVVGVLMAGATWLLSSGITRPLRRLVQFTEQPLFEAPTPEYMRDLSLADEVGSVARALKAFKASAEAERRRAEADIGRDQAEAARREALIGMATTVETEASAAAAGIDTQITAMTDAAAGMSRSAGLVSVSCQSVASASEQALTNAQTVARATEHLSSSIREISAQVAHATEATTVAVNRSGQVGATIEQLAQAVAKVGQVTTLISEIASQTNLLALNATIEAARAGEAGRGFAVVANEVKSLATQTARSTEEITRHIGEIQAVTSETVRGMNDISDRVRSINDIAGSIAAAVEEQNSATGEIARSVAETAKAAQEVSGRIAEVSGEATRTGNEADRVQSLAGDVSAAVSSLRRTIVRAVRNSTVEVDRRQSKRYALDRPCQLTTGSGQSFAARLQNLSKGGAGLTGADALRDGMTGRIQIAELGEVPFVVVHADKLGQHLRFTADVAAARRIDDYLARIEGGARAA
ncbi:MAG TPA: cache domain-containing protein [Xanthobacteraceae bacterium]|nr:cache domain-containing protein [Xanthobacteraceae bacterium]